MELPGQISTEIDNVGMTAHNQVLLEQFSDPAKLEALAMLPMNILKEAKKEPPTVTMARLVQTAVTIEIWLKAPIRIKNMAALALGKSFLPQSNGDMLIMLSAGETKNEQQHHVRLQGKTAQLIRRYLDVDRPVLTQPGSPFLFPGKTADCHKSDDSIRTAVKKLIANRCGIRLHPHLFRHLAGHVILKDHIEMTPVVQRLLGHKRLQTTESFYIGAQTQAAHDHLDDQIERLRSGLCGTSSIRKPRR
jgi:site-specific recombinase XerD